MPPAAFEVEVRRLAEDRTSGALELAIAAIDVMGRAETLSLEEVEALARSLAAAQPAMAAVRNAAYYCLEAFREASRGGASSRASVRLFRHYVETSRPRAGRQLAKVVQGEVTVATLSYSSTVVAAMELLHGRHQLRSVTVLESSPGGEGAKTAAALKELGVRAELAPDAAFADVAETCDLAVFGADTILRDGGIINKVGTATLARAALLAGKRAYAVAETIKLDHTRDTADVALGPESLFEVVPPEALTAIATERGVLTAKLVRDLAGFEKQQAKGTSPRANSP